MRLHRLTTAALAASVALTLAGCGSDDEAAAPEGGDDTVEQVEFEAGTTMARLNEAGTLRVGTKFDQPGFGLRGLEETPEGFDVEIAKIIAAELGIPEDGIEYTEAPSMQRETLLEDDTVDVVAATYTINEARRERIGFAGPYYEAGQDLMVAADDDSINGPDDLRAAGSRVCSVSGSTPSETIREYIEQSQLVLFDVYSQCADALRTGQVDVVTTDNVILLGFVSEAPEEFRLVENPFTAEPYGIGYQIGDTAFCEFINDTLTAAVEDGRYEQAWTSTAGEFSPTVPELPELDTCA